MNRCRLLVLLVLLVLSAVALNAQPPVTLSPLTQKYVRVNSPRVVLAHVRVIDGTGKPAVDDQNVVIEGGKIVAVQPGADVASSNGVTVLDLRGYTVMPGIVGMHNHLFHIARPDLEANGDWEAPLLVPQMTFSSPRMYLAAGVTTMRTTGSVETYADLNLKKMIDSGLVPGPHIDVTGPYLEGPNPYLFMQMHQLTSPEDARRLVNYWADQGVTSFKAYMDITRDQLKAAIEEAHKRGTEGHWPPLLGNVSGGCGAGHRRSGAWLLREHAARSRQAARPVSQERRQADNGEDGP